MVHLRGNTSVNEICLIRAFGRSQALFILSILSNLTFFDLNLVFDIYQEMTTLLVFNSFKRVSLSF